MALETYSDLQASIANWLHRADLTAVIPEFITLAEARLNRVLAVSDMETEDSLTLNVSSSTIALPTGAQSAIALWVTTYNPRDKLTYKLPQELPVTTSAGYPSFWTIDSGFIKFDKPADQSYAVAFRYYTKFQLSGSSATNWLLTKHPDLYLFAALMETAPYLGNDARIPVWQSRFEMALKEVKDEDHMNESLSVLTTELAMNRPYDIRQGY